MACPKFVPSWVLKFHSVGELSCWGCGLKIECQIAYPSVTGKVQNLQKKVNFGQFCMNFGVFIYTVPEFEKYLACWGGQGRKHTKFLVLNKVRDEGFPPFPKEKIDSGNFHGITLVFLPIPKYGSFFFFFFFFLNNITRITFTIGTDWSLYKAEREYM